MQAIRTVSVLAAACVLGACASHIKKPDYSELDIVTVPGCEKPSMQFDNLSDASARTVKSESLPIRVRPGVYTIGIECSWAHDAIGKCVDTQGKEGLQVPPYDLILNPKVRYVFSCELEGKEYVIRMSENARN